MPCDFCESGHCASCRRCGGNFYADDCEQLAEMFAFHDLEHAIADACGLDHVPTVYCLQCGEVLQPWDPNWDDGVEDQALGNGSSSYLTYGELRVLSHDALSELATRRCCCEVTPVPSPGRRSRLSPLAD